MISPVFRYHKMHEPWLKILAVALILFAVILPLVLWGRDGAEREAEKLTSTYASERQGFQQMRDDVALALQLKGQVKPAEIKRALAPVDRLQAMNDLEQMAENYGLSAFSYTLAPEQKSSVPTAPGSPPLVVSRLAINADAALDTQVYAFIQSARTELAGRAQLKQLVLERKDGGGATLTAANLHLTAEFDWLSNSAGKTVKAEP